MITRISAGADAWAFAMFVAESQNRHFVCARERARDAEMATQPIDGSRSEFHVLFPRDVRFALDFGSARVRSILRPY